MGAMDTPSRTHDEAYRSHALIDLVAGILQTHQAVGRDFPAARPALVANLRTLQSALPAAIAEVEAAMKEANGGA